MELTEKTKLFLPAMVHWEKEGIQIFLDPESPHWIAVDLRAAALIRLFQEGAAVGEATRQYAALHALPAGKAWLHVHDFVQALLRSGFGSTEPIVSTPYRGRAAYAKPTGLKELWLHTNNICNLACTHCLVGSAPWVKDWGLPTERVQRLLDEAADCGVERFYFTGGEPFMRKDLVTLIRYVTESKRRELIILTNATLFRGERAEALEKLDRGRVRFQVSIDGASPAANDPIRGKGSFEAAVGGLRLLAKSGFQVSVTTAVTSSNIKELPAITRLARESGVTTQHLMWLHRRGRILEERPLVFPSAEELMEALRQVRQAAAARGVVVDNWESVKQRVNGRPGVKYDLGNACWDSLCVYSDGTVYPSASLANVRSLALGAWKEGTLREIWEQSPLAQVFRNATVAAKPDCAQEPFRYLTGGGDLEHSFSFNAPGGVSGSASSSRSHAPGGVSGGASSSPSHLNGESGSGAVAPERLAEILRGPDPYYPLYAAMMKEAMEEWARAKKESVNQKSGYDVPRIFHAMGEGAIHCATDDLAVTGAIDIRTLHSNCVLAFDVDKPRRLVREFYAEAAQTPKEELCCPTAFDSALVGHIPKEVVDRFYGCGSPVTMGNLRTGERMVDLGSGAGIDCFIAAKLVGPLGGVLGVDMTDEMLEVANRNRPIVAANLGFANVVFQKGFLEQAPVESKWADLVTSNCVINLSPDKPKVFAEIWRILKDNGRMVIADIVSDRPVPAHLKTNPRLWGECVVGALTGEEFLARLEEAGFYGLAVLKKAYWKTIEGFDFYSVTVQGFKFEKRAGCRFVGQKAIYHGPMKGVLDEEGHLFPRNVAVEVCTDTAAKLSKPPYAGSFTVVASPAGGACLPAGRKPSRFEITSASPRDESATAGCGPGCC